MPIYFDNSATTKLDQRVLDKMLPYLTEEYGNASSIHGYGQVAAAAVDQARVTVAECFACRPTEVIFTSGATESNNLAIKGLIEALTLRGVVMPGVITTAIEHDAVLEPLQNLAAKRLIKLTVLGVDRQGVIDLEELRQAIDAQTVLVSVMYVNSEVGSRQPIADIGRIIQQINADRQAAAERSVQPLRLYFHTDATQAVNYFDCRLETLGCDLLSFSGHKIYGPKGVGALLAANGVALSALQHGGHHERNLRSGTLNVPGIVGLAEAVRLAVAEREMTTAKVAAVRNYLVEKVMQTVPDVTLNTVLEQASPAHAHFSFAGAEGEAILLALDLEAGIAVSTGSACASNTLGASKVLLAMGIKVEDTHGAIRFTLGKFNTMEEVDRLIEHLPVIVKKFRDMAPDLRPYQGKSFTEHQH